MKAKPSALQLSTFTKVTSIPWEKSHNGLPVTVRVKAPPPETTPPLHELVPVDVVAVLDVSGSMAWDYGNGTTVENHKLEQVKEAMAKAIQSLGPAPVGGARNRLAVVSCSDVVKQVTPLRELDKAGQQRVKSAVDGLKPGGQADYLMALKEAAKILDERKAADKDRLALIIFLSDGKDNHFNLKDPKEIKDELNQLKLEYPIHAFGVSEEGSSGAKVLQTMAEATSGSYTSITQDVDMAVAEKLAQLSDKLTSIVAVDVSIHLKSLHPAVSLLRIESSSSSSAGGDAGDAYKSQIGDDKKSAEITVGAVSSGDEREFTVYLNVPEGQQGNDGDGGVTTMELLAVGGSYKQSWDQEQVALGESVVTVARSPTSRSSCKELEWIEERVEYWHKVKLDLSAMYDKAEAEAAGVKCQEVSEALRQASMEAIDRAMHHDISLRETATLPSARGFAECNFSGTRQRHPLPSVSPNTHGKDQTLGKGPHSVNFFFAECP